MVKPEMRNVTRLSNRQGWRHGMTRIGLGGWIVSLAVLVLMSRVPFAAGVEGDTNPTRTWRTVAELTADERALARAGLAPCRAVVAGLVGVGDEVSALRGEARDKDAASEEHGQEQCSA